MSSANTSASTIPTTEQSAAASQPITAEDAIQKARMIAARLSNPNGHVPQQPPPPTESHDSANGAATPASASATGHKRKRWGVMPEEQQPTETQKPAASQLAAWLATHAPTATTNTASSAALTAAAPAEDPVTTRRVWVAGVTADKPAAHFVAFCSDQLKALADEYNSVSSTSPSNGTQSDRLDDHDAATREDNGDKGDSPDIDPKRLQIGFFGKGAVSDAPPLPGMPEEPLHVAISGRKVDVDRVVPLVDDVLNQAAKAETDVEAVQAAAAAREQALVLLTTSAAASLQHHSYRPASVAAMIGNIASVSTLPADRLAAALLHGTGGAGGSGGGAGVTEEVHVPNSVVGCIIGRGGETIASLQATTGCKVQIQKEHEIQPGQVDRIITLTAASQAAVDECRRIIEDMVQERVGTMGKGGGGPGIGGGGAAPNKHAESVTAAVQSGHKLLEMLVPDADVGLVIGKMGSTIQQIQDQSGASIQVPRTGNVDNPAFRTLMITHPNEQGAEHAKQLIENVLKSKPSFQPSAQQMQHPQGGPNNGHGQYNQATSIQISIPDKDVGLCIGRGGCVIKHMQQVTQCRIQIPPSAMAGESYRVATISGPPEGCNQVQQMIARIIAEQSSASIMSGAPFSNDYQNPRNGGGGGGNMQHGQHNHHYSQPQQNQQGYSAEWAAYHAAQAAAAAAQEQVATATAASAVASASESTTTATATATTSEYHEQFFRYAYYYGEPAARQYYGAWSPAEGTPNPYGVNPAGIAPAPDASAATAAAPADAQQVAAAPPAPASEASFRPAATATHAAAVVAAEPEAPRETSRRHVSNLPAWMTKKT